MNKMVPLVMQLALYDSAVLVPMASHDRKSHVSPHFGHFDLLNAVVINNTIGIIKIFVDYPGYSQVIFDDTDKLQKAEEML